LTAEGTTSKGTGSISCEFEFCIFYRLSLGTLRTKVVDNLNNVRHDASADIAGTKRMHI